jgi:PAS domain S-box-containing protein
MVMAKTTDLRDIEVEDNAQEKLLDLHRRTIELDQLEILRRQSKIKRRKMEDFYQDFFNQSKDPVLVIRDRKIKYLSPPMAKLLGYTQQEMLNTSFANYVHPDELPRVVGYYRLRVLGKDAPLIYNSILKRRDGIDIPVEIRAGIFPYRRRRAVLIIIEELADERNS